MKSFLLLTLLTFVISFHTRAQDGGAAQVRPVAAFTAISIGSGIELTLTAGSAQRVEVSASTSELRERIRTSVENGVLTIRYENPNQRGWNNSMRNQRLRASVTADQLTALTAGSGSSVRASGNVAAAAAFRLDVSSGANVEAADLSTAALTVRQSSGSTVRLSGRAPRLDVDLSSGATFSGEKLLAEQCRADASSGASIEVAVSKELSARASSGASIRYRGQPQVTKVVSSGGSVSGG